MKAVVPISSARSKLALFSQIGQKDGFIFSISCNIQRNVFSPFKFQSDYHNVTYIQNCIYQGFRFQTPRQGTISCIETGSSSQCLSVLMRTSWDIPCTKCQDGVGWWLIPFHEKPGYLRPIPSCSMKKTEQLRSMRFKTLVLINNQHFVSKQQG